MLYKISVCSMICVIVCGQSKKCQEKNLGVPPPSIPDTGYLLFTGYYTTFHSEFSKFNIVGKKKKNMTAFKSLNLEIGFEFSYAFLLQNI